MLDANALLTHDFGEKFQSWNERDAILYALGVGVGKNPLDSEELRFVDERDLTVLPPFAITQGSPGMWIRDEKFGVDFGKLVHVAQAARFPNRMPPSGTIAGTARIRTLTDRGEGRGAVLVLERTIADAADGTVYCELDQTLLLRGDGGFGGPSHQRGEVFAFDSEADCSSIVQTSQRSALIYRLSGDWNPLHLDPDFARSAGFERPILHGLASYAIAGIAVSRAVNQDPAMMSRLDCRFSGVVFPGDTMRLDIWRDGAAVHFRGFVDDRKVIDEGRIAWRPA